MSTPTPLTTPGPGTLPPTGGLLAWVQASRPRFYIVSVFPVAIGLLLALGEGPLDAGLAVLTLAGTLLLHAGTNLANDYYDYVQYTGSVPFHGGSGVIQAGKLSLAALYTGGWIAFAGAAAIGLYLGLAATPLVWLFTGLGLLGGIYYSAPPVRFGYRGLAEVVCGLSMGPIIVLGTYTVQVQAVSAQSVIASLPLASFVALILFAESIHDIDEDRQTGKWTLAARIGETRSLQLFIAWVGLSGLFTMIAVTTGYLPKILLLQAPPAALAVAAATRLLTSGYDHAGLYRLGKIALAIYLLTGLLLVLGFALNGN